MDCRPSDQHKDGPTVLHPLANEPGIMTIRKPEVLGTCVDGLIVFTNDSRDA